MNLKFCLLTVIFLINGCATSQSPPQNSIQSDAVFIGQFKSVEDFDVAQGDVIEVWNRYQFELLNQKQIEFVSSGAGCRVDKITQDYFVAFLAKQKFITVNGTTEEYQAVLCMKMDSETENYVKQFVK
jgi:hypothetical protein